ncbi:hypothetical protein IAD21_05089 [Abditibacteriota bacterium]|nr:hypothetical protein IAD21_05089 [Abditibacteriota bacterium]
MNRSIFAAGAALALAAAATPRAAHAQSTGLVPVRLKVGALLPTQSAAKDLAGSIVPAAEVDVRIPSFLGGSYATIGYQERGRNGGKLRTVPITISRTFSPPNPAGAVTGNVYFGVGAGAYLLNGRSSVGNSQSRATLGGFAQIGYQTPSKFFVEAKYQVTAQKAAGLSPNGVLLFVGTTF